MQNGDMEIMLHRRLLFDDAFGVGEPLNESAYGQGLVVRGKHWLQFETGGEASAAKRHRLKAQEIFMDAILTFAPTTLTFEDWKSKFNMEFSSLQSELPANVHLLTLEEWPGNSRNTLLLRLEHIFEAFEDPTDMSKPASVKLATLFQAFDISKVEEVTLGANLNKAKLQRLQWQVMNEVNFESNDEIKQLEQDNGFEITLEPFQIRSFIIEIKPKTQM